MLILAGLALATATPQIDIDAANAWVRLLDEKQWDESWNSAGMIFKTHLSQAQWQGAVEPVREPLGAVVSRSVIKIDQSKTLPGAPDGTYETVQYRTVFTHKAEAVETVVLALEGSVWKVDGYFVR